MALVQSTHTKKIIANASFFSIFADEVTTIDHQSWLSLHIYVVIGFKRAGVFLALHGASHKPNMIQPISNLFIVVRLEKLCQAMYAYFSASPKENLEF